MILTIPIRIPKSVLYMNLETRPRGRPRNRWQDEVMEDGRMVGGEEWQEKVPYILESNPHTFYSFRRLKN
jgi:hypothetical protein